MKMYQSPSKPVTTVLTVCSLLVILVSAPAFRARVSDENLKWFANDHFHISHQDDVTKIRMSKMPWESFSADLRHIESPGGFLSFNVKSAAAITLRIDGLTSDNRQVKLLEEKIAAGDFQQVFYTFGSAEAKYHYLVFYVNPGDVFHGEIQFKGLTVQADDNDARVAVFPNPSAGDVFVRLPHADFSRISVYDPSGNVILNAAPKGARSVKLDLHGKKPGLYVLRAFGPEELVTTKIILQ